MDEKELQQRLKAAATTAAIGANEYLENLEAIRGQEYAARASTLGLLLALNLAVRIHIPSLSEFFMDTIRRVMLTWDLGGEEKQKESFEILSHAENLSGMFNKAITAEFPKGP